MKGCYVNETSRKDSRIPWDKDLTIRNQEIIVGRICLHCGEIIETNLIQYYYHPECFRLVKSKRNSKYYAAIRKIPEPKHCLDCGELLPESQWNMTHVKRCGYHQYLHSKSIIRKYVRQDRDITVGTICIVCGEFFPCKSTTAKYCPECRRGAKQISKLEKLTEVEKTNRIKEYRKKTFTHSNKEKLGTWDTAYPFKQHYKTNICIKKGKPDFESEQKLVGLLKVKTFNKHNRLYNTSEGDYLRGIYVD